jgi:hypothetical protein
MKCEDPQYQKNCRLNYKQNSHIRKEVLFLAEIAYRM